MRVAAALWRRQESAVAAETCGELRRAAEARRCRALLRSLLRSLLSLCERCCRGAAAESAPRAAAAAAPRAAVRTRVRGRAVGDRRGATRVTAAASTRVTASALTGEDLHGAESVPRYRESFLLGTIQTAGEQERASESGRAASGRAGGRKTDRAGEQVNIRRERKLVSEGALQG